MIRSKDNIMPSTVSSKLVECVSHEPEVQYLSTDEGASAAHELPPSTSMMDKEGMNSVRPSEVE